jgi:hypothetical protein
VKPESAAFLEKSREFLIKAQGMLDNQWPDEAGRAAYLAGLHAAQALIFEASGEVTKSHKRVQVRAPSGRDALVGLAAQRGLPAEFGCKAEV